MLILMAAFFSLFSVAHAVDPIAKIDVVPTQALIDVATRDFGGDSDLAHELVERITIIARRAYGHVASSRPIGRNSAFDWRGERGFAKNLSVKVLVTVSSDPIFSGLVSDPTLTSFTVLRANADGTARELTVGLFMDRLEFWSKKEVTGHDMIRMISALASEFFGKVQIYLENEAKPLSLTSDGWRQLRLRAQRESVRVLQSVLGRLERNKALPLALRYVSEVLHEEQVRLLSVSRGFEALISCETVVRAPKAQLN